MSARRVLPYASRHMSHAIWFRSGHEGSFFAREDTKTVLRGFPGGASIFLKIRYFDESFLRAYVLLHSGRQPFAVSITLSF